MAEKYIGNVNVAGGIMRVMQVRIIALKTSNGWRNIPLIQQYTAFFEQLDEA
jgi:hypothetical protein